MTTNNGQSDCGGDCGQVMPGHEVTYIAARFHRQAKPWSVTVTEVDGQRATLRYDDLGTSERVWFHRQLGDYLAVGQVLRRRLPGIIHLDDGRFLYLRHESGENLAETEPGEALR